MITFETLTSAKVNTVAIWNEIKAIENAIIQAVDDLGIEYIFGKHEFREDRLVVNLTKMNLGKSSYQQFHVNVDFFKNTVTVQHFNALTGKREDVTIGFDDLDVAQTVMYKHVKNQMQIAQATVKEMEIAYENK